VRIAALDLGSNSFHLVVVETRPDGSFATLVREKEMLRLGDRVGRDGLIGEEAFGSAVDTVRRFRAIAEAEGSTEIHALGTAALREARDGSALVDRIESETGVAVKVVSGVLEARLIFEAVRASVVIDPPPALCADLGGGSLELMVGDGSGLGFATSLHLGVGRLTAELIRHDPPSDKDVDRVRRRVRELLTPVLPDLLREQPRMLIGSSGTLCTLVRMAAAERDGVVPDAVNQLTVGISELNTVRKRVLGMTTAERERLSGLEARRADLVPAGVVVLFELMEASGLQSLTASDWALREGIVISAIRERDRAELSDDPRAIRRASVLALCARCNWRSRHSYHVAKLALQMFDALAATPVYTPSPGDRDLLELGALLHDIGEHVSAEGRDRHSAYLIENGGLRGFDPDEVHILTCLGRFAALPDAARERCTALVALLRLCCALDRSHSSAVVSLDVHAVDRKLELSAIANGDGDLEAWAVRRKQGLFEEVFDIELAVSVQSIGSSLWEAPAREGAGLG
jgi:exopolyphosphatase/guanosine-5'-triphosphate,3'-diphosphate pyrophosphatase